MSVYVPLSDYEGELRAIVAYHPLMGTTSHELATEEEFPLRGDADYIGELCWRMEVMDETYWPPVQPIAGRLEGSTVVALVAPPGMTDKGAVYVRELAAKAGFAYEDAR